MITHFDNSAGVQVINLNDCEHIFSLTFNLSAFFLSPQTSNYTLNRTKITISAQKLFEEATKANEEAQNARPSVSIYNANKLSEVETYAATIRAETDAYIATIRAKAEAHAATICAEAKAHVATSETTN